MSERRPGRGRYHRAALVLAAAGAVGLLATGQTVSAQAAVSTASQGVPARTAVSAAGLKCGFATHDLSYTGAAPARVVAQGECVPETLDHGLFVKIFRNGTVVFSGGNGVGIVTAVYTCRGSTPGEFRAVWSTGQVDEATFPCG
ncbi:hypothetical protein [Nonomuraea sp. NPDC049607]|uniref:hypothetical protein n=1 Tax=Nonomuraea sp. NPDC049607 TaxID=3154732 RepID=UPI0034487C98